MTTRYTVVLSKLAQERFDRFIRADRKLGEQIAKAIDRVRRGEINIQPGYDGVFGVVRVFAEGERPLRPQQTGFVFD